MTSKLNQQDLALIWDLADIQNSGFFQNWSSLLRYS